MFLIGGSLVNDLFVCKGFLEKSLFICSFAYALVIDIKVFGSVESDCRLNTEFIMHSV